MKGSVAVLLAIFVHVFASASGAGTRAEQPLADRMIVAWRNGDVAAIRSVPTEEYLTLGPDALSVLVPEIAKWIPLQDAFSALSTHPDESWKSFKKYDDWWPFLNTVERTHPIRKQWDLGINASCILLALSEKRLLRNQQVLPKLIEGVSHPYSSISRDCFYALKALTKLHEDAPWWKFDSSKHPEQMRNWFREWFAANHKKSLIVTVNLEEQIKSRFLRVAKLIEASASEKEHSLHGFRAPDQTIYHCVCEPLFYEDWDGREIAGAALPHEKFGPGRVFVCVRSISVLASKSVVWDPSLPARKDKRCEGEKLFHYPIPDTDWVIEVYCERLNADETRSLREALRHLELKWWLSRDLPRPKAAREKGRPADAQ